MIVIGEIGTAALRYISEHPGCTQGRAANHAAIVTQGTVANGLKAVGRLRRGRYVDAQDTGQGRLSLTITERGTGLLTAIAASVT